MKIHHFGKKKNRLITDEKFIAKIFNDCFTSIIKYFHIERNEFDPKHVKLSNNPVLSAVNKFQNHPSILKMQIKANLLSFHFSISKL